MTTGRERQLTGAVGEFRVAAELCRRGLLATPFSGNVPHYDIVASGQRGGHVAIQVKAINRGAWQFDIGRFMQIAIEETPHGVRQVPGRVVREPYPGLVFVLVLLSPDGVDRFFVLTWKQLRRIIVGRYRRYLAKHGGVRPRAPRSLHVSLPVDDVADYEGSWDTIRLPMR